MDEEVLTDIADDIDLDELVPADPLSPLFSLFLANDSDYLAVINDSQYFVIYPAPAREYVHSSPLEFRVLATILHVVIFLWGVFGNILLIHVVRKTHSLHRPTYCYLVSLACADLLVLLAAVPEAVLEHFIGVRWVLGQWMCSSLVFLNFLGMNASSLSILAFTRERLFVVLYPMRAHLVCTVRHAMRLITVAWIVSIISCLPWIWLTVVRPSDVYPEMELCDHRLSKEGLRMVFMADTTCFYLLPLLITIFACIRISLEISTHKRSRIPSSISGTSTSNGSVECRRSAHDKHSGTPYECDQLLTIASVRDRNGTTKSATRRALAEHLRSRAPQRMLAVVVIVFAICCLPYRFLLIYNTFQDAGSEFWNIWYLFFAKSLIFVNSAVNPTLYNAFNKQFRTAIRPYLFWSHADFTLTRPRHL